MAAYELTGTVKAVMDQVKFDSGFTKREFVVTTDDNGLNLLAEDLYCP